MMAEKTVSPVNEHRINLNTAVLFILPLIILGGVIWLFLTTGGGLKLTSPVPVEILSVQRTVLKPGQIELIIRNTGPQELQIAQVVVNDAVLPFNISSGSSIPRLKTAVVHLDYAWSYGEAYTIRLFTTNALPFDIEIPVAFHLDRNICGHHPHLSGAVLVPGPPPARSAGPGLPSGYHSRAACLPWVGYPWRGNRAGFCCAGFFSRSRLDRDRRSGHFPAARRHLQAKDIRRA
jgi:hypothetical protein